MTRWIPLIATIGLIISLPVNADRFSETRSNRQKAATTCNDYRLKNRLPCFVSRNRCPNGFEVLERFNTAPGAEFVACRDLRHERPATVSRATTISSQKRLLSQQFNKLALLAQKGQVGESYHLPKSTQKTLSTYFSQISLDKITIHRSKAIETGCFNDCQRIYCSLKEPIDHWTKPNTAQIAASLLHQVAHAERCDIQGGRERFITNWLRSLPDEVINSLEQGSPFDASQIHYENYIERHAQNRTESVCRRILCSKK
ncbi:MAG: hypothetical protein ABW139_15060 [Candidatus Thiodiazotropha sp. DIVDIV]